MGYLRNGQWETASDEVAVRTFVRQQSAFRWSDQGSVRSPADIAPGRYQLYVSPACPWSHTTLILHSLNGLASLVPIRLLQPVITESGWQLEEETEDSPRYLYELYIKSRSGYSGRATVPVLFDASDKVIASNESSEIARLFDDVFSRVAGRETCKLSPLDLRAQIDEVNEQIYRDITNRVYQVGFSSEQADYGQHVDRLFTALDNLNMLLSRQCFLLGSGVTEADVKLYVCLVRFDVVYHHLFRCSRRRISEYAALTRYLKDLQAIPAFRDTTDVSQIKRHYYLSHVRLNPVGIIPDGPD